MRRFLVIFSAAVVLIVAIAAILPFVVPVDTYRGEIEAKATEATGRQLKIDGKLKLTVFPELGVEANKVTLANVPGGHAPYFAAMDSLSVGVKLIPLLSGRIEVSQVTLDKPEINLEADKSGAGNWSLGKKTTTPSAGSDVTERTSFQGIRIEDGRITYRDDATGKSRELDHIDLDIALTSFAEPLSIDGSLVTGGEKISVVGKVASPQALMKNEPTPVDLSLTSDLVQASFKGSLAGANNADGVLKLDTPSLRKLAAWAGKLLPAGGGLKHLSLEGKLAAKGKRDEFSAIKLVLDQMTLTGSLTMDRSSQVPFLSGALTVNRLDLNPYLAAPGGNGAAKPANSPGGSGWSTKPIDFSMLKTINAKLALSTGSLQVRQLKAGRTQVSLTLDNGALNAVLNMGAIYGGSGSANVSVDARGAVPRIVNNARFDGLAIKQFLTDTLGVSRIEGTGAVTMDVSATGKSPNAIMHALSGKGAIIFRNGRIRGVDLASVARTIQNALSGAATSSEASTDFTEMGGTFTIASGVMTNKDLHLLSPFFRMTGAGNINLGEQTIDFVVSPKAVASLKGQGGEQGARGIGIPFHIYGPWSHIHYSPDLSGVAKDILQSVVTGGFSSKSVLQGLFGGQQGTDQTQQNGTQQQKKPNPLDALKGLFGGH